ncbi:MAG: ATP-binding protein [Acidobacteriota bacterium]|nr:ATP-binding protein [Acidobacteriota bacterium]
MRIRSLFLKIFIWFWLGMIVANVALFLSVAATRPERSNRPWRDLSLVGSSAQKSAETYDRQGQGALSSYLDEFEQNNGISSVLLNDQGTELSGRPVPAGWQELASKAAKTGITQFNVSSTALVVAQQVVTPQDHHYVFVSHIVRSPFSVSLRTQALRLLAVLLTGGLFCYGLASYLTTPIRKLRGTTHEFADGNLGARAAARLVQRGDEIGQLGGDFNTMAERLQSMVAAQHRLLGDISHELRSPLARMSVALELARKRAGSDAKSALDRIEHEAETLNEMIGHLLKLTRLESGTDGLMKTEVDLAQLVREVADDADFEARSRNRSVHVVSCDECSTSGTEELLRSAVENVVRNAVRYTAEGTEVEVALQLRNGSENSAVISVRDHGQGVPEEAMDKIFHPFYRTEDARDRESGGSGLGLAIASRAVRLHGGSVQAVNAPTGGLEVTISLPANSATDFHG